MDVVCRKGCRDKIRQGIFEADKAGVKGLGVLRKPAMDVGIHSIKNRQAGEAFHPQNHWRRAGICHHHRIWSLPVAQIRHSVPSEGVAQVKGQVCNITPLPLQC